VVYAERIINSEDLSREKYDALFRQMREFSERLERLEILIKSDLGPSPPSEKQAALLSSEVPRDRVEQVEAELKRLALELGEVNKRAARMRLDRQIRLIPEWLRLRWRLRERSTRLHKHDYTPKHALIVCPVYPGGNRAYGGEFIHKRALGYLAAGLRVTVAEISKGQRDQYDHLVEGVRVVRTDASRVATLIRELAPDRLCLHQVENWFWSEIRGFAREIPTSVWVHGFEARDWRELRFNFSIEELEKIRGVLDDANKERKKTMGELFSDNQIQKIFVSKFMRDVARSFAETSLKNSRVIPNVIDERTFVYKKKSAEDRYRILWVRSFGAKNYANDLAQQAVLQLSKRPFFSKLSFSIFGDGKHFEETVTPLRAFPNVLINQRFVDVQELVNLHQSHGVMLVPTRWDSQGLTVGEAMSSGLVPVTNRIAAIPEFVDDTCGFLCEPDNPNALADAIEKLVESPDLFLSLSIAASKRSQAQCGTRATIHRELEILA
jgi:glycosyltransferase involved in cell wall biosynthesis